MMKNVKLTLPARGKWRIRFIIPGYPTFNIYTSIAKYTTALGPVLLASVAAQNPQWEVEVIDENNFTAGEIRAEDGYPDHRYLQERFPADVVALYGGLSSTIPRLTELARFYREQGCVTVAGGQHFFTGNADEALTAGVDFLCFGEGEQTIAELLDAWSSGADLAAVKGIAYREDGKTVFTEARRPPPVGEIVRLPTPDFSLLRYAKLTLYPVSWSRGCCMDCEFCTVKGNVRYPPSAYLTDQVITLHERFGATVFFIVDDLFGQKRADALDFCRKIAAYQQRLKVRFHFTVQIRLDKAGDTELLGAMRDAGIQVLAVGYESPIAEELKAMNKCLRPEEMIANTEIFHRAGFFVHGMFIFGYPAAPGVDFKMSVEDRENAYRSFIRRAKIDTIQILLPVPLPGTELTARLEKQHRIFRREDIGLEYYDGNFQLFEPDAPLNAFETQRAAKRLMKRFYRLNSVFSMLFSLCTFPTLVFALPHLRKTWRLWFRNWRNSLWRLVGWRIIRRWQNSRNIEAFSEKLRLAQSQPRSCEGNG
ncbi:MAG: radical SAM protein [Victivallaceae bacterium]